MRAFQLVPIVVVTVQLRHLVDLDRGLWRMFDVDIDDVGAEHWRHMGQREKYCYYIAL